MVASPLRKKQIIYWYLALGIAEGLVVILFFLYMPTDPKTAFLLGYTRNRLFVIAASILITGFFGGLMSRFVVDSNWSGRVINSINTIESRERLKSILWITLIVMLYIVGTTLWLAVKEHWTIWVLPYVYLLGGYLRQVLPLLVWMALLCIQSGIALWYLGSHVKLGLMVLQVGSVLLYPGLLLFFSALHPNYYRLINREDYIIEWLTVVFFALTSILAVYQIVLIKLKSTSIPIFLILMTAACLVFALEEISWGQRIFNVESPEYFIEHSDQQEINLHNVFSERFSIRTKQITALVMFAYGVVFPISSINTSFSQFFHKLGIIIPARVLIPGFLIACALTSDRYFTGLEEEVSEFFFSTLLCLTLVFNFWKLYRSNSPEGINPQVSQA